MKDCLKRKLISYHSLKGGTGKTTLTVLVGAALAAKGYKVCLVDLDLMAPGLHHLLGFGEADLTLHDCLFASPKDPTDRGDLRDACYEVPVNIGHETVKLCLVPGSPIPNHAHTVQSYLLAEHRSGLVRARLEHILEQLQGAYHFDALLMDTSPSFMGISYAMRCLVSKREGVRVYVSTPDKQDFRDIWKILDPPRFPGGPEAFVLNRCGLNPTYMGETFEVLLESEDVDFQVLEGYELGVLPDDEGIGGLSSLLYLPQLQTAMESSVKLVEDLSERLMRRLKGD